MRRATTTSTRTTSSTRSSWRDGSGRYRSCPANSCSCDWLAVGPAPPAARSASNPPPHRAATTPADIRQHVWERMRESRGSPRRPAPILPRHRGPVPALHPPAGSVSSTGHDPSPAASILPLHPLRPLDHGPVPPRQAMGSPAPSALNSAPRCYRVGIDLLLVAASGVDSPHIYPQRWATIGPCRILMTFDGPSRQSVSLLVSVWTRTDSFNISPWNVQSE